MTLAVSGTGWAVGGTAWAIGDLPGRVVVARVASAGAVVIGARTGTSLGRWAELRARVTALLEAGGAQLGAGLLVAAGALAGLAALLTGPAGPPHEPQLDRLTLIRIALAAACVIVGLAGWAAVHVRRRDVAVGRRARFWRAVIGAGTPLTGTALVTLGVAGDAHVGSRSTSWPLMVDADSMDDVLTHAAVREQLQAAATIALAVGVAMLVALIAYRRARSSSGNSS